MVQLKKISFIFFLVLFISVVLFPEDVTKSNEAVIDFQLDPNVKLAITAPDYCVTPGDVYILDYANSVISKTFILRVDNAYDVDLNLFGKINARNMLFSDFLKTVKSKVADFYTDANSQITIRSLGVFQVQVLGEVKETKQVKAWGLTRLDSIYEQNKTSYSSMRDIKLVNVDGVVHHYDLFKVKRFGQLNQNPYIRFGDEIILTKYDKQVSITGEVRRPGTYQLLPGDTLDDLIKCYGDGSTLYAEMSEIELYRWDNTKSVSNSVEYIDSNKINLEEIKLTNLDKIIITSKKDRLPLVFFEGAITTTSSTSVIKYQISDGELLSSVVNKLKNGFSKEANLKNVYIERVGKDLPISIDLNSLLYGHNTNDDIVLQMNDRIIIPFRQFFVNVSGEVNSPGRFPYIPNRNWKYYVNMAGGFNNLTHSGNLIKIADFKNRDKNEEEKIMPEDSIVAPSNDIIFNINKYAGIVGTIASVVTSILILDSYISK